MTDLPAEAECDFDELVGQLAEEFTQRLARGEKPSVEEYTRKYPQAAEAIRQIFPALEIMGETAASAGLSADSGAQPDAKRGILGDYRIIREIARGGMGVVHEAEQISLGRRVALKVLPFAAVLDQRQLKRFKNEAQAAASLHHQNIVPVHGIGCERGVHFYAMQYIEGQTLAEVIHDLRELEGLDQANRGDERAESGDPSLADELASGRFARDLRETEGFPENPPSGRPLSTPRPQPSSDTAPVAAISTDRSSKSPAYLRSIAQLGTQVAEALDYAHQEGVTHRDIKPSNLILDARGKCWVTDFGLARVESDPGLTMTGDLLGTLRYMSPEQALAKRVVVDHRTDIYSLGVTLYELLTLQPAFGDTDRQELFRRIAFDEPPAPRKLNKAIPADLETVVLKAMAKNPAERYGEAQDLANDLQRYLGDEPIRARRPTLVQRAAKWSRRHRAIVWSAAALLVMAVVSLSVTTILLRQKQSIIVEARDRAEENLGKASTALTRERAALSREREAVRQAKASEADAVEKKNQVEELREIAEGRALESRKRLYAAQMRLVQQAWEEGHVERGVELLDRHIPAEDQPDLRGFEWYYLWRLLHRDHLTFRVHDNAFYNTKDRPEGIWQVAFTPDGKTLATAGSREVRLRDPVSGELRAVLNHEYAIEAMAISPDGKMLATGSALAHKIRVWNMETKSVVSEWDTLSGPAARMLAFSPDSQTLAATDGGRLRFWDPSTGTERKTPRLRNKWAFAYSPAGQTLAWGEVSGFVSLWDLAQATKIGTVELGTDDTVNHLSISPDGSTLACCPGNEVQLWDVASRTKLVTLVGHAQRVVRVAFSPDGRILATASLDTTVRLWDASSHRELALLRGHPHWVWDVAFSPDGKTLASVDFVGYLKLWDVASILKSDVVQGAPYHWDESRLRREIRPVGRRSIAFSHDGKRLAIAATDNGIKFLDPASGQEQHTVAGPSTPISVIAFSPDDQSLAVATRADGEPGAVRLFNVETHEPKVAIVTERPVTSLAFSPDGSTLATGSFNKPGVRLWDAATGERLADVVQRDANVGALAFSPDGGLLAVGTREPARYGEIVLWDTASRSTRHVFRWDTGLEDVCSIAFSPDGKTVVAVGGSMYNAREAGEARVIDLTTGEEIQALYGHYGKVVSVLFFPDGQTLATAGQDGVIKLWDTSNWEQRCSLRWEEHEIDGLAVSPDGATLVSSSTSGDVKFWRSASLEEVSRYAREIEQWKWYPWYVLGRQNGHDHDLSIRYYTKALELDDQQWVAWYRRGHSYMRTKQWTEAIGDFTKTIELKPDEARFFKYRGQCHLAVSQWDQAVADFEQAVRMEPDEPYHWYGRSRALSGQGRSEQSVADMEKYIDLLTEDINSTPDDWSLRNKRGVAYARLDRPERAVADYTAAILIAPKEALPRTNRAGSLTRQDLWLVARLDLAKAIELAPADSSLAYKHALVQLGAGDLAGYRRRCQAMLERFAGDRDPDAIHWTAWSCALAPRATGDLQPALDCGKTDAETRPDSVNSLTTLGGLLYRAGRNEEAIGQLEKAAAHWEQSDPKPNTISPAYTWYFLAMAEHEAGRTDKAKGWYERAIRLTEEDADESLPWNRRLTLRLLQEEADSVVNRGLTSESHYEQSAGLGQVERWREAVAQFSQAIEWAPSEEAFFRARAHAYRQLDQPDEAQADVAQAEQVKRQAAIDLATRRIDTASEDARAWLERGKVYREQGDYEKAIEDFDEAIRLDPSLATAYSNRATARRKLGDFEGAIEDASQAIRLDPKSPWCYQARAWAYYTQGQRDEAIEDWT